LDPRWTWYLLSVLRGDTVSIYTVICIRQFMYLGSDCVLVFVDQILWIFFQILPKYLLTLGSSVFTRGTPTRYNTGITPTYLMMQQILASKSSKFKYVRICNIPKWHLHSGSSLDIIIFFPVFLSNISISIYLMTFLRKKYISPRKWGKLVHGEVWEFLEQKLIFPVLCTVLGVLRP
jgi:hypothetical protein